MRSILPACCALIAGAIFTASVAEARVYTLRPSQDFFYEDPDLAFGPPKVAIDGSSAIVVIDTATGRHALLFQRAASGTWSLQRTLLSVPASPGSRTELAMDQGKAAIMLDRVLHIFERNASNEWTESPTAGTPQPAPGLAVSGPRILAGRRGCNYDADVYGKSSAGVWGIRGRIMGAPGECNDHGAALDIDGNTAMVRNPNDEVRVYRNSGGTAWPEVARFTPPPGVSLGFGPLSLAVRIAIADRGAIFQSDLSGSDWAHIGYLRPLNQANGPGANSPNIRAGVVLTHAALGHPREDAHVYVHTIISNLTGEHRHVALLRTPFYVSSSDASDRTVIAGSQDLFSGDRAISFFTLPDALLPPPAYANDFTTHDPALWRQSAGSQFARATSGSNFVYRQSNSSIEAHAIQTASNWERQQSIEADITPLAISGTDRWTGLAVHYTDTNNFYYAALRSSGRVQIRRRVDGADTLLADAAFPFALNARHRVKLIVNDGILRVDVDDVQRLGIRDDALTRGNVALLTFRARADFDNVYASPTAPFNLAFKDFTDVFDTGRPFTLLGGNWDFSEDPGTSEVGWSQFSTDGDARAFIGTPTDDQSVEARVRLDAYGTSTTGAWFGLLARWVDARTHYYLTARSSNRLEIKKQINGSITTLASVPFTATPGQFYDLKLTVLGDELHAFVNGARVAQAHDNQIAAGQYGIGTYRAAATFRKFAVDQP